MTTLQMHGTGTSLGDPIEVGAACAVMLGTTRNGAARAWPLVLGSVKTSVGHTETAAGLMGLLTAMGAAGRCQVEPLLHLRTFSPHLMSVMAHASTALAQVCAPRQASGSSVVGHIHGGTADGGGVSTGCSAFAFQGTNVHAIVTKASSSNGTKIIQNRIPNPDVSILLLPWSPRVLPRCQNGSPKVPKWRRQASQMTALGNRHEPKGAGGKGRSPRDSAHPHRGAGRE